MVGERRRETRNNKNKQGPGVFHQVPIATPVHVGKFERQQFILRINLGGIGSALVCTHSNRPSPPMLPHLKCLSHSPSSLSLILSSSSFVCIHQFILHHNFAYCILLLPPGTPWYYCASTCPENTLIDVLFVNRPIHSANLFHRLLRPNNSDWSRLCLN